VEGAEPDEHQVRRAAEKLSSAERPAIFVGGGVLGATAELRALAERLQAPVIESPNARGALPSDHPLCFSLLAGQAIWESVDVALVVGSRFTSTALSWGREDEVEVLRIDVDPTQIGKPRDFDVAITTSARQGMAALLDELSSGSSSRETYLAGCHCAAAAMDTELSKLGNLPALSAAIRNALPRDGILVTDVTQLGYYTRFHFPVYEPKGLLAPSYQATLGYAYPASLGVKLAHPDRKVVAIAGDGGFMFTMQELSTAVQQGIPVVVVVLDNHSYGNVKTIQDQNFGGRNIGVDLHNPDFVAMAKSFGMAAEETRNATELEDALKRHLAADEPALISVPIEEVPSIWNLVKRPPSQGKAPR
jgi:acetolactate synthase-1/2/3 large subunit